MNAPSNTGRERGRGAVLPPDPAAGNPGSRGTRRPLGSPTSESARYRIEMMEQIMRRMGDTAAKNNAALVFLLIPSLIDAADKHEFAEVDPVKYPEYKRSTLTDILEQICQRNRFRAVNLFGPFWERRADDLYLTGEGHWNPRGQAYAAELVSEFVNAQNLLGSASPDARTGS